METAASFEVRNAPSSYPAVRASILPDRSCINVSGNEYCMHISDSRATMENRRTACRAAR
jgi:hypothetical protein